MLKNSLVKFVSEKYKKPFTTFQFCDIDNTFLTDYISYLEKRAANIGTKGALPNRLKKLQKVFNHPREIGIKGADSSIFHNVSEQMKIAEAAPFILSADIIYNIEYIVALLMPNNNTAFDTVKYSRSLRIDQLVELGLLNVIFLLLFILDSFCFCLYVFEEHLREKYFVVVFLAIKRPP